VNILRGPREIRRRRKNRNKTKRGVRIGSGQGLEGEGRVI
jgi:hypothetical protein